MHAGAGAPATARIVVAILTSRPHRRGGWRMPMPLSARARRVAATEAALDAPRKGYRGEAPAGKRDAGKLRGRWDGMR